ncbi:hypothetical protein P775_03375 [Puniceibacterium antarcticum]|uniref:HTH marR-type domain-containing protein n=1 Tax=Puniceibacterium antarcticum TaxID=1206336 RepID=A0A2G8RJE5_9RHOB|nr:MarR family transcriptional regulator [Puniceibacterium antarcticum]PIL21716.1 hypothetical protein P775_03375 [Puniceibacterium antarcticum]
MTQSFDFNFSLFLPYLLDQAAEASVLRFQSLHRDRYGLMQTDWQVLFQLGLQTRLTAQEISARAGIHKTKVSRAVQRLESRDFLRRGLDRADRRRAPLELTAEGLNAYAELHSAASDYETALARQLGDEELETLRRSLLRLAGQERSAVRS